MKKKKKKLNTGKYVRSLLGSVVYIGLVIVFYVLAVLGIILGIKYARPFGRLIFGNYAVSDYANEKEMSVEIRVGDSTQDVAKRLESEKIISDWMSFYTKVKLQKMNIIPGVYTLKDSMSYDQILDIIAVDTEVQLSEEELRELEEKEKLGLD